VQWDHPLMVSNISGGPRRDERGVPHRRRRCRYSWRRSRNNRGDHARCRLGANRVRSLVIWRVSWHGRQTVRHPMARVGPRCETQALYSRRHKEELESAPGFDKDHWPSMAGRAWATDVHEYYEVAPNWGTTLCQPQAVEKELANQGAATAPGEQPPRCEGACSRKSIRPLRNSRMIANGWSGAACSHCERLVCRCWQLRDRFD
jgi:hypothetical protein